MIKTEEYDLKDKKLNVNKEENPEAKGDEKKPENEA